MTQYESQNVWINFILRMDFLPILPRIMNRLYKFISNILNYSFMTMISYSYIHCNYIHRKCRKYHRLTRLISLMIKYLCSNYICRRFIYFSEIFSHNRIRNMHFHSSCFYVLQYQSSKSIYVR